VLLECAGGPNEATGDDAMLQTGKLVLVSALWLAASCTTGTGQPLAAPAAWHEAVATGGAATGGAVGGAGNAVLAAPRQGGGYRPRGHATVRFGGGRSEMDITGFPAGETSAGRLGLALEFIPDFIGGGVQLTLEGSDDDLFDEGGGVDTSVSSFDLYPHLTLRPHGGRFRVPVRIGPYLGAHGFESRGPGLTENVDWFAFGLRAEVEPEIDLVRRQNGTGISFYGRFRIGGGAAGISAETSAVNDDFTTSVLSYGLETGFRFQLSRFLIELGYGFDRSDYDESDVEAENFIRETSFTYRGVFLSMGVRW
jgi:hypothetical protein